MRAGCFTVLVCAAFAAPALALDKKLDPDPAFLAKARTAATASVEPHYDLMSDKVPFWARFLICAGQLTAARDEGRALPVPRDALDKLIADYRGRAAELVAYRQKADAKAPATDIDAEITKIRSGAMQFLPADTTKLGVEHMKKLHGQRVAFCQLTRDWYEVQNGIRTATAPAEQQKLTRQHDEAMRQIAANSAKPPMPPVLRPSTVQPIARAAAQPPVPAAKVVVPAAGSPVGGDDARDFRVGSDIASAEARADFAGRVLWSALAECSARMELIQTRTGDSTKVQQEGYAKRAAYVMWGNRGATGGSDLPAMATPVSQERARLVPRVAAMWDDYRQRNGGNIPNAHWGQVCGGLETYASAYASRIYAERQARAQREHAAAMKQFEQQRQQSSGSNTGSSGSSGGSYGGYSAPSSSNADINRSRVEHQNTMRQYQRKLSRSGRKSARSTASTGASRGSRRAELLRSAPHPTCRDRDRVVTADPHGRASRRNRTT